LNLGTSHVRYLDGLGAFHAQDTLTIYANPDTIAKIHLESNNFFGNQIAQNVG